MRPRANVYSFAEEVILRVAAQARRDRIEATAPKITLLSEALLGADDAAAADLVRDARLAGMPADTLYYGLVAGAVQQVGDAWAREHIAMPEMLRSSHRIWRIMNELRDVFVRLSDRKPGQHAVFAPCPQEGHMFGLTMTADDLRRRGWEIELVSNDNHDDLIQNIERRAPIHVALGATSADMALPLTRLVVALRAHIPGVWVMIGGAITAEEPDLLALTGADALANTADEAEALMLAHLADLVARRSNRV
ncbi:MAG: B12-binding domain-containing protein [Paracoccaceae bacterium]